MNSQDVREMTREKLDDLANKLRAEKEAAHKRLREINAEIDRRTMLAEIKAKYGDRALQALVSSASKPQVISDAGGIASGENVPVGEGR